MPLVRITLAEGRSPADVRDIADGVHLALVETAGVPHDDRFQIVEQMRAPQLLFDPQYLGLTRSEGLVIIQIVLNLGRTVEVKKRLYAAIADRLAERPGVRKEDVLVNLVEVPRENWSFGGGTMSYPPAE